MSFQDHFSKGSSEYRQYRPQYPDRLFSWLAASCNEHELAWDCATGNGQAAVQLAGHFRQVIATDASREQIANSMEHDGVDYRAGLAVAHLVAVLAQGCLVLGKRLIKNFRKLRNTSPLKSLVEAAHQNVTGLFIRCKLN